MSTCAATTAARCPRTDAVPTPARTGHRPAVRPASEPSGSEAQRHADPELRLVLARVARVLAAQRVADVVVGRAGDEVHVVADRDVDAGAPREREVPLGAARRDRVGRLQVAAGHLEERTPGLLGVQVEAADTFGLEGLHVGTA